MKILFALLFTFCALAPAKQNQNISEPEFSDRPYYLKDGQLENVERADAIFDVKTIAFGYGGSSSYYTVFGAQSNVRFNKGKLPRFFIKVEGAFDPSDNAVVLTLAEVKKDRRRFITASSALGGKARNVSASNVKPTLKKVRDGLYEISFENGLLPGEYAFMPFSNSPATAALLGASAKAKLCCFGVD